jgi:hypothetical protein
MDDSLNAQQTEKSVTSQDSGLDDSATPTGEQLAYRQYRDWCRSKGLPAGDFFTWRKVQRWISDISFG